MTIHFNDGYFPILPALNSRKVNCDRVQGSKDPLIAVIGSGRAGSIAPPTDANQHNAKAVQ
jgi:hypothetical protein